MLVLILISWSVLTSGQFVDEFQSYERECMDEATFTCLTGGCIPLEKYCDTHFDCPDGSDEHFCMFASGFHNVELLKEECNETHQYLCQDERKCIPNTWICNEEPDCDDGSDEANCTVHEIAPNATCKGFVCDRDKCISDLWRCDGRYDCDDESDEDVENTCRHAFRAHIVNDGYNCGDDHYFCSDNSFCLTPDQMCDGMRDCRDGSDEGPFCGNWSTMCQNFTCKDEAVCTRQREGPVCTCPGQSYQQYNYTTHQCKDVNDCLHARPQCSHICINGPNNYHCACEEGYLVDRVGYLCYAPGPEAMLFYSTRNDIRYLKIKTKQQFVVATGIKQAHGISFDGTYLYWVETAEGHQGIVRAKIDDPDKKQVLVSLGLESPGDIAIDWMGGNIFFSDAERGIISVCRADGAYCMTSSAITKNPRFVTLDARNGNMFWADLRFKPVIMRAKMDGSDNHVLVDNLTTFASGLAVDAANNRLYYVDRTIKVVKIDDGKTYSLFEERFHRPYSVAVFENTVFWSDWTSNTILTVDKLHSIAEKRNVLVTLENPVFDMHIYHPILMNRTSNPCATAGCSHFCFVTSRTTFSCECPEGMKLKGKICQTMEDYLPQYLVIGAGSSFTRWQYSQLGNTETHATSFNIGSVQAMAYDSLRGKLYLFDGYREGIEYIDMSNFTTGDTHLFYHDGRRNVLDMDYDYVSDTLYVLDAGRRSIEAFSLRTKDRALVYAFHDGEVPISFCVVPEYGRLLVALEEQESNNEIHVDSMGLDGDDRKHLLRTNLRGPHVKLRYSPHMDIVYVSDESQGTIETVHPEGTGREMFRELSTTVTGLAVTDQLVFWTDRRTARLFWADVHDASDKIRRVDFSIFPNNTHLHILATSPPPDPTNPLLNHPCFGRNKSNPCPEVCVQVSHDHPHQTSDFGYKCLCSPGRTLVDGKCTQLTSCKEDELYCHQSNGCVSKEKQCDGQWDCQLGEDEEGCADPNMARSSSCDIGQLLCHGVCVDGPNCFPTGTHENPVSCSSSELSCRQDGVCIPRSLACDGHSDCPDGSDEEPAACDTMSCFETEFMCATGGCIPVTWRCDSSDDCVDGSDELDCVNKTCGFGYFRCGDGACLELSKRCDTKNDCIDHSDEEGCHPDVEMLEAAPTCPPWEYACERNTSICLPLTARCNGKVDCPGETDELGCDFRCAPSGMFACKQELRCLIRKMVCNGRNDCVDGSDETPEACASVNKTSRLFATHSPVECHSGYQCKNGQCVEWSNVCDGTNHCLDGSDEGGRCAAACEEHSCSQECMPSPSGQQCGCRAGFRLDSDGRGCVDVDECAAEVCSQACRNTLGSFICSCHPGYALKSDRRSCKAVRGNMSVLFVSANSVKSMFADYKVSVEYNDPNIHKINDLDYNVRKNQLFVASAETGKLIEANRTQDDLGFNVITNVGRPTRVAVDWITENVYFVDSEPGHACIRVCNVRRKRCVKLQNLPTNAVVSALVVEPASRKMFYCVNAELESVVRSASLSGWGVNDLVTVTNCTGLEVDSFKRRLYVAETGPSRILQLDYDGKILKTMFANDPNLQAPHGLAIFEDSIYFLAANTFKLSRCHLHGSRACEPYLFSVFDANTFVIRHESVQRDDVINHCEDAVCANVCVLGADGPECVCDNGVVSSDGSCLQVPRSELALFNGWSHQDTRRAHSVSFTVMAVVLTLFLLYVAIFGYYQFSKHRYNRAMDYMQVRYQNTPEGGAELSSSTSPVVEVPTAGGIVHEFVNPLLLARNIWHQSFRRRPRPHGTSGLIFDVQSPQDLSDTESEMDVSENKRMLRS